MDTAAVIEAHRRAGRDMIVDGVRSFVREEGDGDPVVCLACRRRLSCTATCYRRWQSAVCAESRSICPAWGSPIGPPMSTTPGPVWVGSPPRRWTRLGWTVSTWWCMTSVVADLHTVPAKHCLPEDQASAIAERVANLTART